MEEKPYKTYVGKKCWNLIAIYTKNFIFIKRTGESCVNKGNNKKNISEQQHRTQGQRHKHTHTKGILAKFQFVSKRVIRSAVHKHRRAG